MDTLEVLRLYVIAAETGSLSAAARELLKQTFVMKFLDGRQFDRRGAVRRHQLTLSVFRCARAHLLQRRVIF